MLALHAVVLVCVLTCQAICSKGDAKVNEWEYFIKDAGTFGAGDRTFKLDRGQTLSWLVKKWNEAHPDRKITVESLVGANGGRAPTRYIAGKSYNMPSAAYATVSTNAPAKAAPAKPGSETKRNGAPAARPASTARPAAPASAQPVDERIRAAIKAAIPFIKKHENFKPVAYYDKEGKKWTVGHGHTRIRDAATGKMRDVREGDRMTVADSDALLRRIVNSNASKMYTNLPWFRRLGQGEMSASMDTAYNAGWRIFGTGKGESPKLNEKMNAPGADPNKVYWSEHDSYRKANGNVVKGLVNRRSDARREFGVGR